MIPFLLITTFILTYIVFSLNKNLVDLWQSHNKLAQICETIIDNADSLKNQVNTNTSCLLTAGDEIDLLTELINTTHLMVHVNLRGGHLHDETQPFPIQIRSGCSIEAISAKSGENYGTYKITDWNGKNWIAHHTAKSPTKTKSN